MELKKRFNYDEEKNILFIDFSYLTITSLEQVKEIDEALQETMDDVDQKVYSIVNYDNCIIDEEVKEDYGAMIKKNQEKYSLGTIRYSNESYTRVSLSAAGIRENMNTNVCKSREEAIEQVEKLRAND